MNMMKHMPRLDYICIWKEETRNIPKKGHKAACFSDHYKYTGHVTIEGIEYRVKFSEYDDVIKLLTGTYSSKKTMVDLYDTYLYAIHAQDRTHFSPVIAETGGRFGKAAMIQKGLFDWIPYFTLSVTSGTRVEIDFKVIEAETNKLCRFRTLVTEPGGLVMRMGKTPRWLWKNPVDELTVIEAPPTDEATNENEPTENSSTEHAA